MAGSAWLEAQKLQQLQLCPQEWRQEHHREQTIRRLKLGLDGQSSRRVQARQLKRTCAAAAAMRADVLSLPPPTCGTASPQPAIPKHPQPSQADRRREAALREALLAGAVPLRDPQQMAMLKPQVMRYKPDTGHLANCTACANQQRAEAAAREWVPRAAPGVPIVLMDGAALAAWEGVAHEMAPPRKRRASFPATAMAGGFGMPGSVLHEGGKYRAWLGQAQQLYFESADGHSFVEPPNARRDPPVPGSLRWGAQLGASERVAQKWWGEFGASMVRERPVRQETFTVMRDDAAPPSERYKARPQSSPRSCHNLAAPAPVPTPTPLCQSSRHAALPPGTATSPRRRSPATPSTATRPTRHSGGTSSATRCRGGSGWKLLGSEETR